MQLSQYSGGAGVVDGHLRVQPGDGFRAQVGGRGVHGGVDIVLFSGAIVPQRARSWLCVNAKTHNRVIVRFVFIEIIGFSDSTSNEPLLQCLFVA